MVIVTERSRIPGKLYFGKYVELNLFKLADQNNSRTNSLTKCSKVCRLTSYENIYSPHTFVCLKPSLLPSISGNFQEHSSSSHVFTCRQVRCFEAKCRRCNEYALDAGTNQQLLKRARMYALINMLMNYYAIALAWSP